MCRVQLKYFSLFNLSCVNCLFVEQFTIFVVLCKALNVKSLENIYDLYRTMERDNIMLSFKGLVTSDLLTSVLQIMESKMEHIEESPKIRKKVYNVLVECLQNLYHHIDQNEVRPREVFETASALFMISMSHDGYEIKTGNYIPASQVVGLREKLERINAMNKDELKDFYKQVLSEGEVSEKGTAGLGLIDIARKSGNKLDYEFLPVNTENSFFCLNVKIA
jgi:hypothetical protein